MDHRGTKFLGFIAATFFIAAAISATDESLPLRAMFWLAPAGQLEALTKEPAIGFRIDNSLLTQSDRILAGEALFHAPSLLGGQAAKAGISCASCHANGRNNPHFQFPGVSGDPGTADVTHSFFSSHRGDGAFNPVSIPDLTKAGKISRHKVGELESFIRGLIVEEFDGAEPNSATLQAVTTYVRALCDDCGFGSQAITLDTQWKRAERAIAMSEKFQASEPELAGLLLSSARHQLGLVHERYKGRKLSTERQLLVDLSSDFLKLQNTIGSKGKGYGRFSVTVMQRMQKTEAMLVKSEQQSLYNPNLLKLMTTGAKQNH